MNPESRTNPDNFVLSCLLTFFLDNIQITDEKKLGKKKKGRKKERKKKKEDTFFPRDNNNNYIST